MVSSQKKKNIAKTKPAAGKGCMREGNTQTLTNLNTLRGGQSPAWGRISVACGNSSAPGPREDSLHAKICTKIDTRVNAGVFFCKFRPEKMNFAQNEPKRDPRGCKITKIWPYMGPKGSQYEPEGCQNEHKGCQGAVKSNPKSDQNTSKNRNLEKGRKRGCAGLSFRLIFDLFLVKKCVQKSMRKTVPKIT